MRQETAKGSTYNSYGDDGRKVEIDALEEHGAFMRALSKDAPRDGVCIYGRFVYTTQHKSLGARHTETESYVDDRRRLYGRFAWKPFKERRVQILLPRRRICRV